MNRQQRRAAARTCRREGHLAKRVLDAPGTKRVPDSATSWFCARCGIYAAGPPEEVLAAGAEAGPVAP